MNINKIITIFGLWALFACVSRDHYSPEVEEALALAGNNRKELVKVLKHYAQFPADSLKFRAAGFLIANMPGKYSILYNAPFENIVAAFARMNNVSNRQNLIQTYELGEEIIREDLKYITSEYLINNIELAFKVWQEQPWGKSIPFDVFREEILPYRVDAEPLENWREKILAAYDNLNQTFKERPDMTTVEACIMTNSQLPRFRIANDMPVMNYSMIMTTQRGDCYSMTSIAIFTMRALGIPVSRDMIFQWPGSDVGHAWNAVNNNGQYTSFMGAEFNPGRSHTGIYKSKGKVYRQTFAIQKQIDSRESDILVQFRNLCIKDVSKQYSGYIDVEIPVRLKKDSTQTVYLATIGNGINWNLCGWSEVNSYSPVFKNVLYLPVYYENNNQYPADYPFRINSDSTIHILEPDTIRYEQLTVTTMSSARNNSHLNKMLNGRFEASNRSDFSDAKTLFIIKEIPPAFYTTVKTNFAGKFRYVRYVSTKAGNCNVAEIKFYEKDGQKLKGKVMVSQDMDNSMMNKAFDNDVTTHFEIIGEGDLWTGLDLGEDKHIEEIHFLPRQDGNSIYEEHLYSLFYWSNGNWQLYEKQIAAGNLLHFRLPSNTLFYLRNNTTGNTTKVFTVIDNTLQWL
jgi:hypothetical protein